MANYLGTVLDDRYEMLEIIGTGGMAVVYKARDVKLNRFVAVKILKDEILEDEDLRSRFHTEAEAVAALSHPNIVNIFDVSITRRMEYFVMELIDGITLKQYMQQRGVLTEAEMEHFITQILKALEHAHSRNIIHRDIKPQNVMILRDGTVKVTDFGIARMANHQQTSATSQNAFGSVHYIAPEQAKGSATDGRADLYSVGIIMYEMMTGELPFTGDTPVAVAIQHLSAEPPSPSAKNPHVTPGMEAIILKAMATQPDDRYSSATEMLADLENYKSNPLSPVGLYKESEESDKEKEETLPTKVVGAIEEDEKGNYKAEHPKLRRQKARFKYNEKLPVVAGILSALIFMVVAVVVFLSLLKGCGTDTGEPVELPNLVGKTYEEAAELLASNEQYQFLKLKKGEETFSEDQEEGTIIGQNPIAGSTVKSNATVKVDISLGIREINMIDVVGMNYTEAANKLSTLFMQNKIMNVVIEPKYEVSETVPMNEVIRTEPELGTPIRSNDTVKVVISSGESEQPPIMPDLEGKKLVDAIKLLTDRKIPFDQVIEEYDDEAPVGTVIGQSIAKESFVKEGEKVDLIVSKGPEPTSEPDSETPPDSEPTSEPDSETPPDSEPTSEPDTSSESESGSAPDSETGDESIGVANYSFQPKALASEFSAGQTFQVMIKANGVTVWFGANVTIESPDIPIKIEGKKGESCKFEVEINGELFTTYVEEFK
ncbi:MAG: Stk1 family PASTA domain-containing Ser/Thr kinase [Clostridia bacterium]|nr:Stk1 family PASTA domain-containing Ser/Thr kinase [Clostridia bacterium]